jgi:phosphoglycerol transferase MdoB-like AlkP superfamily enzyme
MSLKKSTNYIYQGLVAIVFSIVLIFLGQKEGYAVGRSLMVSFIFSVTIFNILIFRKFYFGILMGAFTTWLIFIVSDLKYRNMGVALNYSDFRFYQQSPSETLSVIKESLSPEFIAIAILICLLFVVLYRVENKWKFFKKHHFITWLTAIFLYPFLSIQINKSFAVYLYGSEVKLSNIAISQSPSISGFASSLFIDGINVPLYPKQKRLFPKSETTVPGLSFSKLKRPNIIVWLEESTFDPAILKNCNLEICKSSMFSGKSNREFYNPLRVHTWGGGTWTSEFSLLSGLDHSIFGPLGWNAPITIAPILNHALPRYLKSLGYQTIALYPVSKSYLNAGPAYHHYGFNHVQDFADEGETIKWNVSDQELFDVLKKILNREQSDQPIFAMMLTMYQHGPHDDSEGKPRTIRYRYPKIAATNSALQTKIENYLYRMKESEKVVNNAEDYLSKRFSNHPWVFVHFGDHQPGFENISAVKDIFDTQKHKVPDLQKVTYFKIKSNYKLPDLKHYDEIDLSYLGNYILKAAELPLDSFYRANETLMDKCSGKYFGCEDRDLWESYANHVFRDLRILDR